MYFSSDYETLSSHGVKKFRKEHERVGWGIYAPHEDDPWQRYQNQCAAALARLQPSAFLAGVSAAVAWGLPLVGSPPTVVTVGGIPRGRYREGVVVLPGAAQSTQIGGLRVANPIWTLVGCARTMKARDALIVADAALHLGHCSTAELREITPTLRGTTGAGRVRWMVDNADPLSESPGETWTRMVAHDLGYDTVSQHQVRDGDFSARLDLLLEGQRIALEFDGLAKYALGASVEYEKQRQSHLERLGYRLLRILWEHLYDPAALDLRIRNAGGKPMRRPRHRPLIR